MSGSEAVSDVRQDRRAVWLLLICVTLWSTSGVLIKESTLPAMAIVSGRSLLTAIVVALYIRRPHFTWSLPQIGGAVMQAATFVLFVMATQMTSAANAILLQYTAPLWVALFGIWYLHERPRRIDYITMAMIAFGMLLFFGDKLTGSGMVGNILAIISGITMAWMTLFLRKQKDGSPMETILLGNILAAVIGLPFLLTVLAYQHGHRHPSLPGYFSAGHSVHLVWLRHCAPAGAGGGADIDARTDSESALGVPVQRRTARPDGHRRRGNCAAGRPRAWAGHDRQDQSRRPHEAAEPEQEPEPAS